MITPCEYCGKPVEKEPYYYRNAAHHFCNSKCYGKWMQKRYTVHNRKTGALVIENGTSEECRKAMGVYNFHTIQNHVRVGKNKKWKIDEVEKE